MAVKVLQAFFHHFQPLTGYSRLTRDTYHFIVYHTEVSMPLTVLNHILKKTLQSFN